MTFPTASVLDTFVRANEGPPPSSSWTDITNGLKVVSNEAAGDVAGDNHSYWNTAPTSGDQDVYTGDITLPGNGETIGVGLRITPGGLHGYVLEFTQDTSSQTDTLKIIRVDSGTETVLETFRKKLATGDRIGLQAVGVGLIAFHYAAATGLWRRLGTAQDATYSSGNVSLAISGTTGRVASFGGGNHASSGSIRADIFDIVSGASTTDEDGTTVYTGSVHDYKRYGRALYEPYLDLFKITDENDDEVIQGFDVMAGPISSQRMTFRDDGQEGILRNHTFFINGYIGWNDSKKTEKVAELLAQAIIEALDNSNILHTDTYYYDADPAQVTALDGVRQGNILCNHITIQQNVYVLET